MQGILGRHGNYLSLQGFRFEGPGRGVVAQVGTEAGGAEDGAAERQPCEGAGGDCVGDRGSGADEDGFRGGGLTFARKGYTLRRFRQGVWAEGVNWTRGVLDARGKSVPTKKLSSAEPGWAHSHQWFVGLGVSTSVASAAEHKFLPFQSGVRARHGLSRKGKLLTLRTD